MGSGSNWIRSGKRIYDYQHVCPKQRVIFGVKRVVVDLNKGVIQKGKPEVLCASTYF